MKFTVKIIIVQTQLSSLSLNIEVVKSLSLLPDVWLCSILAKIVTPSLQIILGEHSLLQGPHIRESCVFGGIKF